MKLRLHGYLIIFLCLILSCNSDDDGISPRTIEIGDQIFDVNTSGIIELGTSNQTLPDTHYGYFITLTDRSLDTRPNGLDASYELIVELYSPGGMEFKNGEFRFVEFKNINASELEEEFVFSNSGLTTDTNEDGEVNGLDDYDRIVSGSITTTGAGENLEIIYDVELSSGIRINTSFSGGFSIF